MIEVISTIVADPGERLDVYLSRVSKKSRASIQEQIEKGCVTVNGNIQNKTSYRVKKNDEIVVSFKERPPIEVVPVEGRLDVLYEDDSLLAINKPQGLIIHPAPSHQQDTVVHYLLHYLKKEKSKYLRPGIVHRLDKGTSGVLVIAKDKPTEESLSRQFKEREILKIYHAIVWGKISEQGMIESKIGRHKTQRKKISSYTQTGKHSVTFWRVLEYFPFFSWLEIMPKTGRTHQIRVHLSEKGFSIVGDPTYGGSIPKNLPKEIESHLPTETLLHAKSIEFLHPKSQKKIKIEAPLPTHFQDFIGVLRRQI